jgi:hypothetical protein
MTEVTTQATETTGEQTPALPEELGGWRIAGLLSERLDVEVTMADIDELVDQEHLVVVDYFKRRPMYATAAELVFDEDLVRAVVSERLAWEAASLTPAGDVPRMRYGVFAWM